jgi:hypothetical protein
MLTWGFSRNLGDPVFSTRESATGEAEPEFSWPTGVVFGARSERMREHTGGTGRRPTEVGRDGASGVGASHSSCEVGEPAIRGDPVERRACRRVGVIGRKPVEDLEP